MSYSDKRRVATLYENGEVELITEDTPKPAKGEILVQIEASVVSPGTHLNVARQNKAAGNTARGKSKPFGYQGAGVVAQVGENVKRFSVGDRVACMGPGALHTDLALIPVNLAVNLPDNVTFEQGAYCHLAATALQAIRRGKPHLGEFVFIAGLGVVGQVAAQLARIAGSYVMASDALPTRLQTAQNNGAHGTCQVGKDDPEKCGEKFTNGGGFDMALVAFGGEPPEFLTKLAQIMRLTPDGHNEGRIVVVGGLKTSTLWASGMGNVDVRSSARTGPGYHDESWEHGQREYPYPWIRWGTQQNLDLCLRLIGEGRLNVDSLTTHRVKLEDIDQPVKALLETPDEALGCVVTS